MKTWIFQSIQNCIFNPKQAKSHKIFLFKILQLFYHVASQTSSIFTCNICTKYRGLFSGYFLTAYALQTVILLAFWRSFQRVPWQMKSTFIIVLFLLDLTRNALFARDFGGLWNVCCRGHLGKIEQDGASYYGLLVVKLVVKQGWFTTKDYSSIFLTRYDDNSLIFSSSFSSMYLTTISTISSLSFRIDLISFNKKP